MIRRVVGMLLIVLFLQVQMVPQSVALTTEERLNVLEERVVQLERALALSSFDVVGLVEKTAPAVVSLYVVDADNHVQRQGTGFFVMENGMIFTNAHVIRQATTIKAKLASGVVLDATILLEDPFLDFAVVEVTGNKYPYLTIAQNSPAVGSPVVVIGNAYGYSNTVTTGVVSGVDRPDPHHGFHYPSLQTDAAINHGNSGGPILNTRGEVVAMAAWTEMKGETDGIAFGIPMQQLMTAAAHLVLGRGIVRPWLGIAVREPYWAQGGLSNDLGLVVSDVHPLSAAARAGLLPGDWIEAINTTRVNYLMDFRQELERYRPGDHINVKVSRNNPITHAWRTLTLTVTLDEYSEIVPAKIPYQYDAQTDDLF